MSSSRSYPKWLSKAITAVLRHPSVHPNPVVIQRVWRSIQNPCSIREVLGCCLQELRGPDQLRFLISCQSDDWYVALANPGQAHENPRHSAPVPVDQSSRPLQGMDNQRANLRINDYPGDLHEAPSHAGPIRPLQPVHGPPPDREKPKEKTKEKERRDISCPPGSDERQVTCPSGSGCIHVFWSSTSATSQQDT